MSAITTHVLDTTRGIPAAGVAVSLEILVGGDWRPLGSSTTDGDGRCPALLPPGEAPVRGTYRLRFETGAYFALRGTRAFHPQIEVVFLVDDPAQHHHVPLLLSPFGYTTYRGS